MARAPELRRAVRRAPILCGPPLWVDDPTFSLARHVHSAAVSPPGDEASLIETAESLLQPLLDRHRPLWEMWFLTGLQGGRFGLLFKLHHAVADGLAAAALLGALFDDAPDTPDPSDARWVAAPAPSGWALFADDARGRVASLAALSDPAKLARAFGSALADARRVARAWSAAPRTSLNGSHTGARRARVVDLDVETARRIAHAHAGKINDVVLSIVAGGLRDLLLERGEPVDGVELVASVPVALRTAESARVLGNAVGSMVVPLRVGEADASKRLAHVVRATRAAKSEGPVHADAVIASLAASGLARPMARRQRTVNVFVTNVRGPRAPLYVLGARIERLLPFPPIAGNVRLSFAAASYCQNLAIVANADGSVEDIDVLAAGMERAWSALATSTG